MTANSTNMQKMSLKLWILSGQQINNSGRWLDTHLPSLSVSIATGLQQIIGTGMDQKVEFQQKLCFCDGTLACIIIFEIFILRTFCQKNHSKQHICSCIMSACNTYQVIISFRKLNFCIWRVRFRVEVALKQLLRTLRSSPFRTC